MDPLSREGSREARETVTHASYISLLFHFMAKFKLKSELSLDGNFYGPGESVELTAAQAEELAEIIDNTRTIDTDEGGAVSGGKYDKLTKKELVAELTTRGAEFDPNATNANLKAILEGLDVVADEGEAE
jgi:hypothetical protein